MTHSRPLTIASLLGLGAVIVFYVVTQQRRTSPGAPETHDLDFKQEPPLPAQVTFAKDIAPIVFGKCAACHQHEGVAPFPLMSWEDARDHAQDIKKVTGSRYMPPWRPVAGYAEYANDRSLPQRSIDLIARWVDQGAKRGDEPMPPAPSFKSGWQLGEPDVVFQLNAPWNLSADGKDVYRNFVVKTPVAAARYVKAWEFRPGTRAVHHAILNLDRYGLARRRDERDAEPGFEGMDVGEVQSADGFYLVWTPGKTALTPDDGAAFRIDAQADVVLQLHLQPTGKAETVNPTIGLFFADRPPPKNRRRFTLRVGDPPIDIPAGDPAWIGRAEYVLPAEVEMVSVFPHAHYIATKLKTWAVLPDGTERGLLRIDDWDFNWQDEYTFAKPIVLPAGTKVAMEFTYDNSARNVRNPNRPPRRVQTGERSVDEMGNVTFQVIPRDEAGMNLLRESKYRRQIAAAPPGGELARDRYNLGNALGDLGKRAEAIAEYRRALAIEPKLTPARFNLGRLLIFDGKLDEAIAELRIVVKEQPSADAHVNLGLALESKGDRPAAFLEFRAAVQADPSSAVAQNSLGLALARRGDHKAAIVHFNKALAIDPDNWRSHFRLGESLAATGAREEAIVHQRRAIELDPNAREPRDALEALTKIEPPP